MEPNLSQDILESAKPFYSQPEVFVGVPLYGGVAFQALLGATSFACKDPTRHRTLPIESPVLCGNLNALWCCALNIRKEIPFKYHAQLHHDIHPARYWVDTCIELLDKYKVDLISVVMAIKDDNGLSSTAVLNKDTLCTRRLSMTEIVDYLPPTFTSKDLSKLGHHNSLLLHGSGMWVCRFDLDWVKKVWFECPTKIIQDAEGNFVSAVWDEGWNFSLQLYNLGLKIACTREVGANHLGGGKWGNQEAWGEWKTDCGDTNQSWILGKHNKTRVEEIKPEIYLP